MKNMKRIVAVVVALIMIISVAAIGANAEENTDVALTITTDKNEYIFIDIPYVTVKVENKSGRKLTGVVLNAQADNWVLDTKKESSFLEIGEMQAGEIRELNFKATEKCGMNMGIAFLIEYFQNFSNLVNNPKVVDSYNFILDSFVYFVHRVFNSCAPFVTYSDDAKDCVEQTLTVAQSNTPVTITASVWFDKAVKEEKYEPVYNEGRLVIGSYPQSEVKEKSLLASLNSQTLNWQSYGYYVGSGSRDGTMAADDFMRFADIEYNGEKYRAVTFDSYRMVSTFSASVTNPYLYDSYQNENNYFYGNVYWFKFEPLEWRVLDENTGLVMCESIIDAQPYSNYILNEFTAQEDINKNEYGNEANDWETSSIREWLNEDFYNTAFTDAEKKAIAEETHENKVRGSHEGYSYYDQFNRPDSTEKVFLLSFADVVNSSYGFSSDKNSFDSARFGKGTDYAKCQGLHVYHNSSESCDGCSYWWLRTVDLSDGRACDVYTIGSCTDEIEVCHSTTGVRPAITVPCISE